MFKRGSTPPKERFNRLLAETPLNKPKIMQVIGDCMKKGEPIAADTKQALNAQGFRIPEYGRITRQTDEGQGEIFCGRPGGFSIVDLLWSTGPSSVTRRTSLPGSFESVDGYKNGQMGHPDVGFVRWEEREFYQQRRVESTTFNTVDGNRVDGRIRVEVYDGHFASQGRFGNAPGYLNTSFVRAASPTTPLTLEEAIEFGNIAKVQELLTTVNTNQELHNHLLTAIRVGSLPIVALLLEHPLQIMRTVSEDQSPFLTYAVQQKNGI